MQYAIELYFDPETEQQLRHLSERIAEEGLSSRFLDWKTRPHLTLACFSDVDEAACSAALAAFARSRRPWPACIGSVGMFTDTKVIFASPVMTEGMYQFQREVHQALHAFDTAGWDWYLPDRWLPHCTLALMRDDPPEAFYRASELVLREFRKMNGMFRELGLVKVTFPVEEVFTVPLGDS